MLLILYKLSSFSAPLRSSSILGGLFYIRSLFNSLWLKCLPNHATLIMTQIPGSIPYIVRSIERQSWSAVCVILLVALTVPVIHSTARVVLHMLLLLLVEMLLLCCCWRDVLISRGTANCLCLIKWHNYKNVLGQDRAQLSSAYAKMPHATRDVAAAAAVVDIAAMLQLICTPAAQHSRSNCCCCCCCFACRWVWAKGAATLSIVRCSSNIKSSSSSSSSNSQSQSHIPIGNTFRILIWRSPDCG